eukprot:TRINITY_DN5222_c0_g2_i1.p1 TRINITY_DN5222_c0_g2~~TRINITY_DN5222_c0_g2_i1.p1  ORF type:complete len:1033 (+),score=213.16 TRINITY_DN5222_c0_g2_i1:1068-4166(+)
MALKRYSKRRSRAHNFDAAASSEEEIFPAEYLHVDRIVARREGNGPGAEPQYHVKWRGLPYTDATWEIAADIADDDKLAEYRRFHVDPGPRPAPIAARVPTVVDRARVYKGGNTLSATQVDGLNWLIRCWCQRTTSVVWDSGGWTRRIEVIAFLLHLQTVQNINGPFLVVTTPNHLAHWERELHDWTNMNVVVYQGNVPNRKAICEYEFNYLDQVTCLPVDQQRIKFSALLTSYADFNSAPELAGVNWQVLVADAAQHLGSGTVRTREKLVGLHAEHRIVLASKGPQLAARDLLPLAHLCATAPREFDRGHAPTDRAALYAELVPHLPPEGCGGGEAPPRVETTVLAPMTVLQRQAYCAVLQDARSAAARGGPAATLARLREVCTMGCVSTDFEAASGKLQLLARLVPLLRTQGRRVAVAAHTAAAVERVASALARISLPGERIDPRATANAQRDVVARFRDCAAPGPVLLLQLRRRGLCHHSTAAVAAADVVVLFDSAWDPSADITALLRRRPASSSSTQVFRLVCGGGTCEQLLLERAYRGAPAAPGDLTRDDLAELLRPLNEEESLAAAAGAKTAAVATPTLSEDGTQSLEQLLEKNSWQLWWDGGLPEVTGTPSCDDAQEAAAPMATDIAGLHAEMSRVLALDRSHRERWACVGGHKAALLSAVERSATGAVTNVEPLRRLLLLLQANASRLGLSPKESAKVVQMWPSATPVLEAAESVVFSRKRTAAQAETREAKRQASVPVSRCGATLTSCETPVSALQLDWIPENSRSVVEVFLQFGRPCWKKMQKRCEPASKHQKGGRRTYTQAQIACLLQNFLQQCAARADVAPVDRATFEWSIRCLEQGRPRLFNQKRLLRSTFFEAATGADFAAIAARLRALRRLDWYLTSLPQLSPPLAAVAATAPAPAWTPDHDHSLLLGVHNHGWGCYDAILAAPEFASLEGARISAAVLEERVNRLIDGLPSDDTVVSVTAEVASPVDGEPRVVNDVAARPQSAESDPGATHGEDDYDTEEETASDEDEEAVYNALV